MDFSETKQAERDASEYYPDHCHTERGGSKTHPIHSPADSCQHPVLTQLIPLTHVNAQYRFNVFHIGKNTKRFLVPLMYIQ